MYGPYFYIAKNKYILVHNQREYFVLFSFYLFLFKKFSLLI